MSDPVTRKRGKRCAPDVLEDAEAAVLAVRRELYSHNDRDRIEKGA